MLLQLLTFLAFVVNRTVGPSCSQVVISMASGWIKFTSLLLEFRLGWPWLMLANETLVNLTQIGLKGVCTSDIIIRRTDSYLPSSLGLKVRNRVRRPKQLRTWEQKINSYWCISYWDFEVATQQKLTDTMSHPSSQKWVLWLSVTVVPPHSISSLLK